MAKAEHRGYTKYPSFGHSAWTPAYNGDELLPWLVAQKRDAEK